MKSPNLIPYLFYQGSTMLKNHLSLCLITSLGTLLLIPSVTAENLCQDAKSCTPTSSIFLAQTKTAENLRQIAQDITVRIYTGDTSGSGVLIAKNEQTYTVVTNAHVVKRGQPYRIQTPDGIIHQATLQTSEDILTGKDLAVLQFESANNYNLANLATNTPQLNENTYAAGFPYDSQELSFYEGQITLITTKPIVGGYRLGFNNLTQQGMSGGVLLNQEGKLIGILGKGNAILTNAYDYADGTRPDAATLKQMQQASFAIPSDTINFITQLYINEEKEAAIPRQVNQIAEQITVRIDTPSNIDGSGVIIGRNGQTYYVLTASHVIGNGELTNFKIITPDGKSHAPQKDGIKTFNKDFAGNVDIAVIEFTSPETYQVATLADYSLGKFTYKKDVLEIEKPIIFLSGFPNVKSGNPSRKFTAGLAFPQYQNFAATKDKYALFGGTDLVYNALSLGGMSGGAVLDQQGRLIGINTESEDSSSKLGEQTEENIDFGNNSGVPIKIFLGQLNRVNLKPQWFKVETKAPELLSPEQIKQIQVSLSPQKPPTETSTATEWFNYGKFQERIGQNEQAIAAYDQAIKHNPQFYQAYYLKGLALNESKNYAEALVALEKVIEIKPDFELAWLVWYWKAETLYNLKKYPEALVAIDRAMQLKKEEPKLYQLRGFILSDLERDPEAEEALTKAIELKPSVQSYMIRASVRSEWDTYKERAVADNTKAIELQPNLSILYYLRSARLIDGNFYFSAAIRDIETAIKLDPNKMDYYWLRGNIHWQLKDNQATIADYTKVIDNPSEIDSSRLSSAYSFRGSAYHNLEEYNKAIADINKAIELDPKNADLYQYRSTSRYFLKDFEGAVADFSKVIEIKPDSCDIYLLRSRIFQVVLKDEKKAIADLKKAVEICTKNIQKIPNNPRNYLYRSAARKLLGDTKGAEEDRQKAKQLTDEDPSLIMEGQDFVQKFRQKQKRMQAFYTQEIATNPNNPKLYFYRGIVSHGLRDYQGALADFNRSIQLNSNYPEAYYQRGLTYQSLKDYSKALADYNQALKLNIFEDTDVYFNRGLVKLKLADYQGAIQDLDSVIERQPENLPAWANKGDAYVALKDYVRAIQSANKILEVQPEQPEPYFARGVIYQKQGNNEAALADYNLALEKNERLVPAIINIGYILYEKGEIEPALKQWQKAIEIDSKLAEPQLALAVALYAQGEQTKGIEMAKQALTIDKTWANIDTLKTNLWGDKLIAEAQKLLQNPEIVTFLKKLLG